MSFNQNSEKQEQIYNQNYNFPRERIAREVREVEPPAAQVGITLPRNDLVYSDFDDSFVKQKIYEDFNPSQRKAKEHNVENPEINSARLTMIPEPAVQNVVTLPRNTDSFLYEDPFADPVPPVSNSSRNITLKEPIAQSAITLPRGEASPPNINASRNTIIHEPIVQTALTLPRGDPSSDSDHLSSYQSSKKGNTFSFERKPKAPLKMEVRGTLIHSATEEEAITLPRNPNKQVRKQTPLQQSLVQSRNPARSDVGHASPNLAHNQLNYNNDVGYGYQDNHPSSPPHFQSSPANSVQYHVNHDNSNHGSPQQYDNVPIYDGYKQEIYGLDEAKYAPATRLEPAQRVVHKRKLVCVPVNKTARIICFLLIFAVLTLGGAAGYFLYPRNLKPSLLISAGERSTSTALTKSGDNYNVDFSIPLNLKLEVYNPLLLSKTVDPLVLKTYVIADAEKAANDKSSPAERVLKVKNTNRKTMTGLNKQACGKTELKSVTFKGLGTRVIDNINFDIVYAPSADGALNDPVFQEIMRVCFDTPAEKMRLAYELLDVKNVIGSGELMIACPIVNDALKTLQRAVNLIKGAK